MTDQRDAAADNGGSDEIAKLLALLVRLQLDSQAQAILEFHKLGFSSARIAELLGTTPATARATVHQKKTARRRKASR